MWMPVRCARVFIANWRQILLVGWSIGCLAIVVGSLMPTLAPPAIRVGILSLDKLIHFSAYGLIAFLPQVAIARSTPATWAALSMAVLGGVVEVAQDYVPGREGSLDDVLANALGVFGGIALGLKLRARRVRLRTPWDLPEGRPAWPGTSPACRN